MMRILSALAIVAMLFPEGARAAEPEFLSREAEIARGMLAFAGVDKDDVIYDLGYGNGALLVEAARLFGCRGTGVYSDNRRLEACLRDADEAGVTELVSFTSQDPFHAEISRATVVCVYLLPRDGVRLRPHLFASLKPGTRVVSRDFSLGAWRPDARTVISGSNVYRWTIPANLSGTWKWEGKGNQKYVLNIDQEFQEATGRMSSWPVSARVSALRIDADNVFLSIETDYAAEQRTINFEGKVTGNIIEGMGEENGVRFIWQARRVPDTARPLDTLPE